MLRSRRSAAFGEAIYTQLWVLRCSAAPITVYAFTRRAQRDAIYAAHVRRIMAWCTVRAVLRGTDAPFS